MVMTLIASVVVWLTGMSGCLPPGNTAENTADCHTDTCQVSAAQDITRHHLACSENILAGIAAFDQHSCPIVYGHTEVGEGYTGS
jgi:hypothetical protein